MTGAPDERWDNDVLHQLAPCTGADFEAVDTSVLMVDAQLRPVPVASRAAVGSRRSMQNVRIPDTE